MARYERTFRLPISTLERKVDDAVMNSSVSVSLEESSHFSFNGVRCAIRVYERYSFFGGNRVSMNVTMVGDNDSTKLVAVTSGGSQAVFFKINTVGEDAFLDVLREALQ